MSDWIHTQRTLSFLGEAGQVMPRDAEEHRHQDLVLFLFFKANMMFSYSKTENVKMMVFRAGATAQKVKPPPVTPASHRGTGWLLHF